MPRKSVLPIAETGQGNKEKTAVPEKTAVKDNQQ
jgi:hypothetical protein